MKTSYLKYLNCFCGSDDLSCFSRNSKGFQEIAANDSEAIIHAGYLICQSCGRKYTVNGGLVNMLPDDLFVETAMAASDRDAVSSASGAQTKDAVTINKKNEMSARNQEASVYHNFLNPVHVVCEQNTFKEFLDLSSRDVVVELGCGTGKLTRELTASGAFLDYIAVDFSEESIKILAAQMDKEAREKILFVVGDVCNLPIKPQIADKIVSAQVFEHIPGASEQLKFIKEIRRIFKPDGRAALTIYNYNIKKRLLRKVLGKRGYHAGKIYYENFTRSEVVRLFKPYFDIKKNFGLNSCFPFLRKFDFKVQKSIEYAISGSFLNSALGNIMFIGLEGTGHPDSCQTRAG